MAITTKTGDKGTTQLYLGGRVPKDDLRVQACGDLDELSSALGLSKSLMKDNGAKNIITCLQQDLFLIGAEIATRKEFISKLKKRIDSAYINRLDASLKALECETAANRRFCLPGDNPVSSCLDIARTVARRAERNIVTLKRKGLLENKFPVIYLNRLSDLLYLLARKFEKKRVKLAALLLIMFAAAGIAQGGETMKITSPEFGHNQFIPKQFTCQGNDYSPALIVEGVPAQAKSLALIMDDPDAPMGTWVHWVVFDIPVTTTRIEENSIPGKQGRNNFQRNNYGGPCPPSGTHRYFFKLYALDCLLNQEEGITKGALEKAMQGHILEKAELIGLYKKER